MQSITRFKFEMQDEAQRIRLEKLLLVVSVPVPGNRAVMNRKCQSLYPS